MGFDIWVHPEYPSNMDTTVTLDNAGRVVIPKSLRDELHLEPGDKLRLQSEGERVTLQPVRASTPLQKERGVWVYRSGRRLPAELTDRVLKDIRDERDARSLRTSD
jgi:AbrB family looped-hinge helix DNA binding protein